MRNLDRQIKKLVKRENINVWKEKQKKKKKRINAQQQTEYN